MATYQSKYQFYFVSQNGAEFKINISAKDYTGPVFKRALGRAPILKRESNGNIYGTSLEIYAECKVDGEFAEFYSNYANEYTVDLYKNNVRIWSGYITPELYSEPDIAPPYDVQIIATDGLGDLRRLTYEDKSNSTIFDISGELSETALGSITYYLSTLKAGSQNVRKVIADGKYFNGQNRYEVVQKILSSMHAFLTVQDTSWVVVRETDIRHRITDNGLLVEDYSLDPVMFVIEEWGSARNSQWWPIGSMSKNVVPAKSSFSLTSTPEYKNGYKGVWKAGYNVQYDEENDRYIIADTTAAPILRGISALIGDDSNFEWSMSLSFSAEFIIKKDTSVNNLGVLYASVMINTPDGKQLYYYQEESESGWSTDSSKKYMLSLSQGSQDVELILPLKDYDGYQPVASNISIEILANVNEDSEVRISNLRFMPAVQFSQMEVSAKISSKAREKGESIEVILPSTYVLEHTSNPQTSIYAVPLDIQNGGYISQWSRADGKVADYMTIMVQDYAESLALPRMSVRGTLNVPKDKTIPLLFKHDNEYYIVQNYSYNLINDEVEVSLLSIPDAEVEVGDIIESGSQGSGSGGGTSSGGGSGSINASFTGLISRIEALERLFKYDASTNTITALGNLTIEGNTIGKNEVSARGKAPEGESLLATLATRIAELEQEIANLKK